MGHVANCHLHITAIILRGSPGTHDYITGNGLGVGMAFTWVRFPLVGGHDLVKTLWVSCILLR